MLDRCLEEIGVPKKYSENVFRIVETQEYAATTKLVDDLDEQFLLEQMLDEIKPAYRDGTKELHYLISTPFRYPPLRYGSRFGDVTMPSYFYASEDIDTALAECAFYRFAFLTDMEKAYLKPVNSEHMSFSVKASTNKMSDTTLVRSSDIKERLTSPLDYQFTQVLGRTLNKSEIIRFVSARFKDGVNVAISEPSSITSSSPENTANWICQTTNNVVSFRSHGEAPVSFMIEDFMVNGVLPRLA